jgi:N-acetylmuramoyl-L-alanine amidase
MAAIRKKTDLLVVHCAATKASMDIGAKEIRRWHKDRGWDDIGYHYVIRRNGDVEIGRPENAVGAHVAGKNSTSVGICLVGGIDDAGKPKANFTKGEVPERPSRRPPRP